MLLAIDTATRAASLALYGESGVVAEATWRALENHTTSLMPEMTRLMDISGVKVEEVQAVAVSTGPGSFTGLRVGLSLAKGLASGRGLALVGIPTLDGLAHAFADRSMPIWTVLDAGRKRYAVAKYVLENDRARRVTDYLVGNADYVAEQLLAKQNSSALRRLLVCGEVDANLRSTLMARLADAVVFASPAQSVRRAAYLAELGWARWQADDVDDVESLAPYYLPTPSLPQEQPV